MRQCNWETNPPLKDNVSCPFRAWLALCFALIVIFSQTQMPTLSDMTLSTQNVDVGFHKDMPMILAAAPMQVADMNCCNPLFAAACPFASGMSLSKVIDSAFFHLCVFVTLLIFDPQEKLRLILVPYPPPKLNDFPF